MEPYRAKNGEWGCREAPDYPYLYMTGITSRPIEAVVKLDLDKLAETLWH